MHAFIRLAAVLAMVLLAPLMACAAPAYTVDYDRLYLVDLDTRQATLIGAAGSQGGQLIGDLSGLTTLADGRLYAISDTIKSLLRIDPATGAASVVGRLQLDTGIDPNAPLDLAMAASCSGDLWLSSAVTGDLWRLDPSSAQASHVGSLGSTTITGLVAYGDQLFGIGGRGDEGLYSIDPATAAVQAIGDGFAGTVDYLASASPAFTGSGEMLAVLNYVPPPAGTTSPADWSDLARIDPETGEITVLGNITGPDGLRGIGIRGFTLGPAQCSGNTGTGGTPTSNPSQVPATSPLTLLLELLAIGLAGILVSRRRLRRA